MLKELLVLGTAVLAGLLLLRDPARVDNFSAGPATLPLSVLKEARSSWLSYGGRGMSIFEMSHRDVGGPVQTMMSDAEAGVREVLRVPQEFAVFYMSGGAHAQFAAVPLNLGPKGHYVQTGYWSSRAADEAHSVLARESGVTRVSGAREGALVPTSEWNVPSDASYVFVCASETIDGIEFLQEPQLQAGQVLVGDFTSTLLSRAVDVSKYGVIFASGGKNLGPSGMTLVIVRRSLIKEDPSIPSVLSWHKHAYSEPIPSIYNTPPILPIYMHKLVLDDLIAKGGMPWVEARAKRRAQLIYDVVDSSKGYYYSSVRNKAHRSRMNVPMLIGGPADKQRRDLEDKFVREAEARGMTQLFGHKVRGGLRVTLYNGVTDAAVERVAKFLDEFRIANPL